MTFGVIATPFHVPVKEARKMENLFQKNHKRSQSLKDENHITYQLKPVNEAFKFAGGGDVLILWKKKRDKTQLFIFNTHLRLTEL